jgi:hypothetical protein
MVWQISRYESSRLPFCDASVKSWRDRIMRRCAIGGLAAAFRVFRRLVH